MNSTINKVVCIDVRFNDNNWIFRKDQENISIDDYSNYLIIVVVYYCDIFVAGIIKEHLKKKFNNHEEMYNFSYDQTFCDAHALVLLNKNTHYKYIPYDEFIKKKNELSTDEQYVVCDIFGSIKQSIDQTNYNITNIPKENYTSENIVIIEKRFIQIKKAVKS